MADSPTRSSVALDIYLNTRDDVAGFARLLGVDPASLWRYRRGKTMPPGDVTARIERLSNGAVTAAGWAERPPRKRSLPRKVRSNGGNDGSR